MPDDLATAALFLVSTASSYVTATSIPVDGGWL
jgi:2-deoxy-D-gluconate 3-dehydrogenase